MIEVGAARVRLSTLTALADVFADDSDQAARIVSVLTELAGPTLVEPNRFSVRRQANKVRREARAAKLAARALPVAEKIAEQMVDEILRGHYVVPIPQRDRTRQGQFIGPARWWRRGLR
jgi:hypothetical protein